MTTMGDIELGGNEPADGVRALPPLTSRRMVLASGAALTIAGLVGGALVRRSEASDDDEDHSGPGGGGDDDDNSGPGGGGDDREDHHGLPPAESTQVAGITTVRIVDERFEPNDILIETGQTITWQNLDDDQHTASGGGWNDQDRRGRASYRSLHDAADPHAVFRVGSVAAGSRGRHRV